MPRFLSSWRTTSFGTWAARTWSPAITKGKKQSSGYSTIAQETPGSFHNEIHDILANDGHGVAVVTASGQRGNKTMSIRGVHNFHMDDGSMTEFWNFSQDQAEVGAF